MKFATVYLTRSCFTAFKRTREFSVR